MAATIPLTRDDFQVAIICAPEVENDTIRLIFDELWDASGDSLGKSPGDTNHYATGRVGEHNVVLVRQPQVAREATAKAATDLFSSYRELRLALLVGLCGAVPTSQDGNQIILGDVIISDTIVEYDFEKEGPSRFSYRGTISGKRTRQNRELRNLVGTVRTARGIEMMEMTVADAFRSMEAKDKRTEGDLLIKYPGAAHDKLYQSKHRHMHRDTSLACECISDNTVCKAAKNAKCDELGCNKDVTQLIARARLRDKAEVEQAPTPMVHIGSIASGETAIQSAADRDDVMEAADAIGFEVDGAGIWVNVSCIVVKGVCDYADGHTQVDWQRFASATAASASRAVLEWYNPKD